MIRTPVADGLHNRHTSWQELDTVKEDMREMSGIRFPSNYLETAKYSSYEVGPVPAETREFRDIPALPSRESKRTPSTKLTFTAPVPVPEEFNGGNIHTKYLLLKDQYRKLSAKYDELAVQFNMLLRKSHVNVIGLSSVRPLHDCDDHLHVPLQIAASTSPSGSDSHSGDVSSRSTGSGQDGVLNDSHDCHKPYGEGDCDADEDTDAFGYASLGLESKLGRDVEAADARRDPALESCLLGMVETCKIFSTRQAFKLAELSALRAGKDYVSEFFCIYNDSAPGFLVVCEDYLSFIFAAPSPGGEDERFLPILFGVEDIVRVEVKPAPVSLPGLPSSPTSGLQSLVTLNFVVGVDCDGGDDADIETVHAKSSASSSTTKRKMLHHRFWGFESYSSVLVALQGPDGKLTKHQRQPSVSSEDSDEQASEANVADVTDDLLENPTREIRAPHLEMYSMEMRQIERELRTRLSESALWPTTNLPNGVRIATRTPPDQPAIHCVTAIIDALPREVFAAIYTLQNRLQWDKTLGPQTRVIEQVDAVTEVLYIDVPENYRGLVSPRDYIDIRRWTPQKDGGFLISYRGLAHYPNVPTRPGVIRGRNHTCGVLFEPVRERYNPLSTTMGGPSCLLTIIVQTEANGWIPQRLIDRAVESVVTEMPDRLRRYLRARGEMLAPAAKVQI